MRCELLKSLLDLMALVGCESCGVAARPVIRQACETGRAIGPHPSAQTGKATLRHIENGLEWVGDATESHRRITGLGIAIGTFIPGAPQLADLLFISSNLRSDMCQSYYFYLSCP